MPDLTMKNLLLSAALTLPTLCYADNESVDHFQGEEPQSLAHAKMMVQQSHQQIEALLRNEKLTTEEIHELHELTYSLENAVAFIQEDIKNAADALETLHKASETYDPKKTRDSAKVYLQAAKVLSPAQCEHKQKASK